METGPLQFPNNFHEIFRGELYKLLMITGKKVNFLERQA